MTAHTYLASCLLALGVLFVAWSLQHSQPLAGLLVFALPPALLLAALWRGWPRAGFTAALLALLWFSHGVMLLWSAPAERHWAAAETLLALLVIHAACLPGWRARSRHEHR
ncbi:DUF2069 domain-containing protein [Thermomonas hydrothermalis]|uniref:Uncharacterized membrane protein n=1 Tax=Thermomonas hydrothermalis TaxID=213588 RepID=A0A1M4S482_9GAMM|nr:DUF2069 domain-containing protein [Thermomonas hydrothermalis]SHE27026.1 Uncharacterized membrane protein [Thermomonas hydrothermalis]